MGFNHFKLEDLLELRSLAGIRVLTGKHRLDTDIYQVNVMEVPDVADWVQAGEFLMTTGYPMRDDLSALERLIPLLQAKGVAGLGIKPGRFIDQVPPETVRRAERLGFPLFLLPPETAFSNVIREVMECIIFSEEYNLDQFIRDWLTGNITSEQALYHMAHTQRYPLDPDSRFFLCLLLLPAADTRIPETLVSRLNRELRRIEGRPMAVSLEGHLLLLVPLQADSKRARLEELLSALGAVLPQSGAQLCVSKGLASADGVPGAYRDVRNLGAAARAYGEEARVITWNKVGIYSILSILPDHPNLDRLLERLIRPLERLDHERGGQLLDTLALYFRHGGNIKATAEALHAHYNTVVYRINKLCGVLEISLDDPETSLQLQIALKLYHIHKVRPSVCEPPTTGPVHFG